VNGAGLRRVQLPPGNWFDCCAERPRTSDAGYDKRQQCLDDREFLIVQQLCGSLNVNFCWGCHWSGSRAITPCREDPPRAAYRDFLALWEDSDRDIPILQQAKAEYANLQIKSKQLLGLGFASLRPHEVCLRASTGRLAQPANDLVPSRTRVSSQTLPFSVAKPLRNSGKHLPLWRTAFHFMALIDCCAWT
jgi:hypothetical protein